jgi:hypothetical protein
MESSRSPAGVFLLMSFPILACSLSTLTGAAPQVAPNASAVPTVERTTPAAGPTVESSTQRNTPTAAPLTPTPAVLDLEILEWSEWPYAHPADPSNTDTHVEVLIRNPNDFPVRVLSGANELRFMNAAGEVVFTNPSSLFYIWQGSWMLPGETAALSACVCFQTSGMEKQEWESLALIAPLEVATDLVYTLDVEVTLGEIINLNEMETTLANTGDRPLESIPYRVLARDASGRYVGVAFAGNAVVSFGRAASIQPGDTAQGLNVIELDYVDMRVPLTYEVAAIGILARPPANTPLAEWNGIPIMPGAIAGSIKDDGYEFTTAADFEEITSYYEDELSNLGFEVELQINEFMEGVGQLNITRGESAIGAIVITTGDDDLFVVGIITFN